MKSLKIKHPYKQIHLVQKMMKFFIEKGYDSFESFCEIWKNNKISEIHSYISFRHLIFGSCQTAISTFIGYCAPQKTTIERKGGIFGLYLTYKTQFSQTLSPIQLSTLEFDWIKAIAKEFPECNSIFSFLIRSNAFCFVPNQTAIYTKFSDSPSPVMIDEIVPLNDAFNRLENRKDDKHNYEEESNENIDEMENDYNELMKQLKT